MLHMAASTSTVDQNTGKTASTTSTRSNTIVQQDVLDELDWDPRIPMSSIGVTVKDGVVTLFGQVESYSQRHAAEQAAFRVLGVHAVANELTVRLPSLAERTDSDLAAAAMQALVWDAQIPTEALDLTVSRGWVTLKGTVPWGYQRTEAEHVIQRLAGVRGISNQILVRPPVEPKDIASAISRAFARQAQFDAHNITIEAHGSTITLVGKVRSYSEKEAAGLAAWSTPGVTAVENLLKVGV